MPVDSVHSEYSAYALVWQQCRDCIAGERAVKAAGEKYLPRLSGQTRDTAGNQDYQAYLQRAMFYPASERTVVGLMGAILRKPPAIECPDSIAPHLEDVTMEGRSLTGFVIDVLEEVFKVSRGGILLDMPRAGGNRPYWVRFTAEQIINWRSELVKTADGGERKRLRLLVLQVAQEVPEADPFVTKTEQQYLVLELVPHAVTGKPQYQSTIWTKPKDGKEWLPGETFVPSRRGEAFDEIPFVFFGPRDTDPCIDKPVMEDLTNVNLSHYRSSADLETGAHYTAIPTPVVSGVDGQPELRIGATTAWVLQNPQAKAEFLEFTGQGLSALETRCEKKEHLMATIGARLLESQPSKQETAAAVRMRHSGDHATLTTIVVGVSEALTQVLRWHVWWAGLDVNDDDVTIALNTEFFDTPMTPEELKAFVFAWQSGTMSDETYYWNMQRGGIARPGVTFEQEKEAGAFQDAPEPEPPTEPEPPVDPNADPNADPNDEKRRGRGGKE